MILSCKCKHPAQDKFHGKGNRVFNKTAKGPTKENPEYSCTVCNARRTK